MGNLIVILKNKNTNNETTFVFNDGVYKLAPGSKDNFIENKIDKINFIPIENVFQLMIGTGNKIQSITQKQEIYTKYLNFSDYNFSNYNVKILTDDDICLFDSEVLNLNVYSFEISDEYGIDIKDVSFGLTITLYSTNNIKENNNG